MDMANHSLGFNPSKISMSLTCGGGGYPIIVLLLLALLSVISLIVSTSRWAFFLEVLIGIFSEWMSEVHTRISLEPIKNLTMIGRENTTFVQFVNGGDGARRLLPSSLQQRRTKSSVLAILLLAPCDPRHSAICLHKPGYLPTIW